MITRNITDHSPERYARTKEQILRTATKVLRYIPGKNVRGLIKDILGEIHDIQQERSVFVANKGRMMYGINGNERYPNGDDQSYNDFYKGTPQAIRAMKEKRRSRVQIALASN